MRTVACSPVPPEAFAADFAARLEALPPADLAALLSAVRRTRRQVADATLERVAAVVAAVVNARINGGTVHVS